MEPRVERQMDFAHPASPQERQEPVMTGVLIEELCRWSISQRLSGNFQHRLINEAALLSIDEQRFDFLTKRFVIATGLGEKSSALVRVHLQRGPIKFSDFFVAFRRHCSVGSRQ